jgi:hypothetical protein
MEVEQVLRQTMCLYKITVVVRNGIVGNSHSDKDEATFNLFYKVKARIACFFFRFVE